MTNQTTCICDVNEEYRAGDICIVLSPHHAATAPVEGQRWVETNTTAQPDDREPFPTNRRLSCRLPNRHSGRKQAKIRNLHTDWREVASESDCKA